MNSELVLRRRMDLPYYQLLIKNIKKTMETTSPTIKIRGIHEAKDGFCFRWLNQIAKPAKPKG